MDIAWIGIDVSKGRLDAALFRNGKPRARAFANDAKGRGELLGWARTEAGEGSSPALCVESTGPYHLPLARLAHASALRVAVENPRRVLWYGRALGLVGKTDPADARLLARYGEARQPRPWAPASDELARLAALDRRLEELEGLLNQERNRLEDETLDGLARESVERVLAILHDERAAIRRSLEAHVAAHERLAEDVALLQSVPGVGPRAAVGFLAETAGREFESGEQVAAYADACPRRSQSGKKEGPTRISRQGNAVLRRRLYLPAVGCQAPQPDRPRALREARGEGHAQEGRRARLPQEAPHDPPRRPQGPQALRPPPWENPNDLTNQDSIYKGWGSVR